MSSTDGSALRELITAAPANAAVTKRNVGLADFMLEYIMHFIEMAKRAPRAANSRSSPLTRDSTEPLTVGDFFATNQTHVVFVHLVSQYDDWFIARRTIQNAWR